MVTIEEKINKTKRQILFLQEKVKHLKRQAKNKGFKIAIYESKSIENYILQYLSDKQKEFYYILKSKNINKIKEWLEIENAYPTIKTFKIMGILQYNDDIFDNDYFIKKLETEGIKKFKARVIINNKKE